MSDLSGIFYLFKSKSQHIMTNQNVLSPNGNSIQAYTKEMKEGFVSSPTLQINPAFIKEMEDELKALEEQEKSTIEVDSIVIENFSPDGADVIITIGGQSIVLHSSHSQAQKLRMTGVVG